MSDETRALARARCKLLHHRHLRMPGSDCWQSKAWAINEKLALAAEGYVISKADPDTVSVPRAEWEALRRVADIMARHTHQHSWAMTRYAGEQPERDCHLCRALVAAGVLTIDQIGAGTRAALSSEPET